MVGGPLTMRIALAMCLFVGLTAAVGCETGFTITYVNETDKTIAIYYGDDYDFSEYDFIIQPHSTERAGVLTITFKGVVIGRDEEGNLLFTTKISRGQLKAQQYRFVITEDMLSPTPAATPPASPPPQ
jgi:hypothetical protein